MWPLRRMLKYGFVGSILVGGASSLHANQYNIDSIGVVRLSRSAMAVSITQRFLLVTRLSVNKVPKA